MEKCQLKAMIVMLANINPGGFPHRRLVEGGHKYSKMVLPNL